MESLEKQLQRCEPDRVKLIVTDGVFSMEGDVANLPEIVRLAKKYNASIMVDEAHGIGVFGRGGRGTCDHFGVTDDVDLVMGTFSKSFASLGGFIATDKEITNFLRHHSRSYSFTHSSTPIIPLFIRDDFKTFKITRELFDEGLFVNPVVTPAVAPQDTLIRFSLMATHTKEQVEYALEKFEKVFRNNGIIK